MKLWSIQSEYFYNKLVKKKYIKTKSDFIDGDFLSPYNWMTRQMKKRLQNSSSPSFPLWAWFKYNGANKKPDLRRSGHLPRGTKGVCIEFAIEDHKVLLSQFEMWVCALNGLYVPYGNLELHEVEILERSKKVLYKDIQRSWERMFDLSFGDEKYWGKIENRWIQACVEGLCVDQVVNVTGFMAR